MKKLLSILTVSGMTVVSLGLMPQAFAADMSAHMTGGKVTAINGTTLNVTNQNRSYTVDTTTTTKIVRRFGGVGTLSQISVGDHINIAGMWTDTTKTTVNATLIRDGSIQEANSTFSGSVTSVSSTGFVLQSMHRDQQTVMISSTTKLVNKKGATISQSTIATGNSIVVEGLWDRALKTITANRVRDLSL